MVKHNSIGLKMTPQTCKYHCRPNLPLNSMSYPQRWSQICTEGYLISTRVEHLCQYWVQICHLFTTTVSRWRSLKNLPRDRRWRMRRDWIFPQWRLPRGLQSAQLNQNSSRLAASVCCRHKQRRNRIANRSPRRPRSASEFLTVLSSRWSELLLPDLHSHTSLLSLWLWLRLQTHTQKNGILNKTPQNTAINRSR